MKDAPAPAAPGDGPRSTSGGRVVVAGLEASGGRATPAKNGRSLQRVAMPALFSHDAEEAVLSAILLEPAAIETARSLLRPEHFFDACHQKLFSALLGVAAQGIAIDPLTLADELERRGRLETAGGKEYIGYLVDAVPTAANIEYHARIVLERAMQRDLMSTLADAIREVESGRGRPGDVARDLSSTLGTWAPPQARRRLFSDIEIDQLCEPDPLIEGIAFDKGLVCLIGKYGTLKTFVLLDMAMCIAAGIDWHGRRVRQGSVVYIYAEGAWGIKRRKAAWKAAAPCVTSLPIHFLPSSVLLSEPVQVADLISLIKARGLSPVAVFVDTVARNMTGDESKVEDMGRFVQGCDAMREAFGCAMFLAHHTPWVGDRSRGSTSLPGALDTEILVDRHGLGVTLKCTKQKEAAEFDPISLEAFQIAGSLALRSAVPSRPNLTRNERHALSVLQASDGLTSTAWFRATGLAKGSYDNARKRLIALGYVRVVKKIYRVTKSGSGAVGTTDNLGTGYVQPPRSDEGQHTLSPLGESVVPDPQRDGASRQ